MKKFIPFIVCVILCSACVQSKQGIVQDLLEAENSFEKEKVNQFLSDSFMFFGPDTLNKEGYLFRMDSLKSIECQSTILKIQVLDSIVKTEEREQYFSNRKYTHFAEVITFHCAERDISFAGKLYTAPDVRQAEDTRFMLLKRYIEDRIQ